MFPIMIYTCFAQWEYIHKTEFILIYTPNPTHSVD